MNTIKLLVLSISLLATIDVVTADSSKKIDAHDPGVRQGVPSAGSALAGLDSTLQEYFATGQQNFNSPESTAQGLGPRFNLDVCGGCHSHPALGGSSPAVNPQIALATAYGAKNVVPSFLSLNGPVREVRFVSTPQGAPDGGVHSLFVISGRNDGSVDASGCTAVQENFDAQYARNNLGFRIPTPLFGSGLLEQITDGALTANLAQNQDKKNHLGISGHLNHSGNTGNVTRFGWKAQNPSVLLFGSEAYNVEMGISNENFPVERDSNPNCQFASRPNDIISLYGTDINSIMSSSEKNAFFLRFLAPPTPSTTMPGGGDSIARGQQQFSAVGCDACHTPSFTTDGNADFTAFNNQTVSLFSDLAVHNMGPNLADGIQQGSAAGDEFRTAPLWGLGQRIFFLHDGRTSDLVQAIQAHASQGNEVYQDSEANKVVKNFSQLEEKDQQDLLNFLRSL